MLSFVKESLLGLLSIFIALVLLAIVGEVAIRAYYFYQEAAPERRMNNAIELDNKLGWRATPNYRFVGELVDAEGQAYHASVSTDDRGFRLYGDPEEQDKKKMLVVGDSFTHAVDTSDDKTYFASLADELSLEMFAIGVRGYGTLQQYMLLDEVYDEIDPDIVLIQFCGNDFINNSFELELAARGNNNGLRRPYLEGEEVVYRIPKDYASLREFAYKYSRLLYLVFTSIDRLDAQSSREPREGLHSEKAIVVHGRSYPPFRDAIETTDRLFARIRARVPTSVPIYVFIGQHGGPIRPALRDIAAKNDMHLVKGVSRAIKLAERSGNNVHAADGAHWNDTGHRIVAAAIRGYLEEHRVVRHQQPDSAEAALDRP